MAERRLTLVAELQDRASAGLRDLDRMLDRDYKRSQEKGTRAAKEHTDALDKQGKEAKETQGAFRGLTGSLTKLTAAVGVGFLSWQTLRQGLIDSIRASAEHEQVMVRLTQAGFANVEAVDEWAESLQRLSGISSDVIANQAAITKNLGASEEQAKLFTQAAIETGAALGRDWVGIQNQLNKTLGGTLGELSEMVPALKTLTAEQLQAGEAAEFLLAKYSGNAAAQLETLSGAYRALAEAVGDLQRAIGDSATQGGTGTQFLTGLEVTVRNITDGINSLDPTKAAQYQTILELLARGAAIASPALGDLGGLLGSLGQAGELEQRRRQTEALTAGGFQFPGEVTITSADTVVFGSPATSGVARDLEAFRLRQLPPDTIARPYIPGASDGFDPFGQPLSRDPFGTGFRIVPRGGFGGPGPADDLERILSDIPPELEAIERAAMEAFDRERAEQFSASLTETFLRATIAADDFGAGLEAVFNAVLDSLIERASRDLGGFFVDALAWALPSGGGGGDVQRWLERGGNVPTSTTPAIGPEPSPGTAPIVIQIDGREIARTIAPELALAAYRGQ